MYLTCALLWMILPVKASIPPQTPPDELISQYTINETIPIEYYYVDDTLNGQATHIKFSFTEIEQFITETHKMRQEVLMTTIPRPPKQVHFSMWLTQLRDTWLIHALNDYKINGKTVVVFGSTSPFYESLALEHGAAHVSVIEYNTLTYGYPNISTYLASDSFDTQFDVAFSISSFDHDGLGRYGDPLNPNGDILAMEKACELLKPVGGLLFLSVPIGPDVIVWNLHRRYGRVRLPLLLEKWKQLSVYGMDEMLMNKDAPISTQYEPIFVLERNKNC